jgi:hypothetical protein
MFILIARVVGKDRAGRHAVSGLTECEAERIALQPGVRGRRSRDPVSLLRPSLRQGPAIGRGVVVLY